MPVHYLEIVSNDVDTLTRRHSRARREGAEVAVVRRRRAPLLSRDHFGIRTM
jgi:hypothetical protein